MCIFFLDVENKQTILSPIIIFISMQNVLLNFMHQLFIEFKVRLKSKGRVRKLFLILFYNIFIISKKKKVSCSWNKTFSIPSFKATSSKFSAWIPFTRVIRTHNVIIAPGHLLWLLMHVSGNKMRIVSRKQNDSNLLNSSVVSPLGLECFLPFPLSWACTDVTFSA